MLSTPVLSSSPSRASDSGEADYFDGGQLVELVGGGACGSMSPASPEGVIQLEYRR